MNSKYSQGDPASKSVLGRNLDRLSIFRAEIKEKLNDSNFEPFQDHMDISKRDIDSFDGFSSSSRVPPVLGLDKIILLACQIALFFISVMSH